VRALSTITDYCELLLLLLLLLPEKWSEIRSAASAAVAAKLPFPLLQHEIVQSIIPH
jgi:hypothetical protein